MLQVFVTALTAFLVATAAVAWLARGRIARIALDQPNARSLHTTPIPRTGGLGMLLGIAASWMIVASSLPLGWWISLFLVITVSLADDLRGLNAATRLCTHLVAATLAAFTLLPADTELWLITAVILGIGWTGNLYNFMDGSDGLAGGMAVIGFGSYATAAWFGGNTQFALLNLAIALSAAGFLVHNFHPARIFMGDAGAVTLGFLAASLGLLGWLQGDWIWWFPLLVFSPFIVDASTTLLRRLLAGARVWEAHRDHYYQRLVQLGLGHRDTALAEYALMTLCAFAGLWAMTLEQKNQYLVLAAAALLYVATIIVIESLWRKRQKIHA